MTNTFQRKLLLGAAGAALVLGGAGMIASPAHAAAEFTTDDDNDGSFTTGTNTTHDTGEGTAELLGHGVLSTPLQINTDGTLTVDANATIGDATNGGLIADGTATTETVTFEYGPGDNNGTITLTINGGASRNSEAGMSIVFVGEDNDGNADILAIDFNGNIDLGTGTIKLDSNNTLGDVTVNFSGETISTGGITLDEAAIATEDAIITFDGTTAQSITGDIAGSAEGAGVVNVTNIGGTVTFNDEVGPAQGTAVNLLTIGNSSGTSTVIFADDVYVADDGDQDGGIDIGLTDGGSANVTFRGDVVAEGAITMGTGATVDTNTLTLDSRTKSISVTGNTFVGGAAADTNALVVTSNDTIANTVTLGTDMGANFDTVTVEANTDFIAKNVTATGDVTLNSGSILRNSADADVIDVEDVVGASDGVGTVRADNNLVVRADLGNDGASLAAVTVDAGKSLTLDGATDSEAIAVYSNIELTGASSNLIIAADNSTTAIVTVNGNITAGVADQGLITVTDASTSDRFTVTGDIGTSSAKILNIDLGDGNATSATFGGNVYLAGELELDDETDTVILTGGTSTTGVTFDGLITGNAAGEGTIQVGNGTSDTAFVTFDDGIADGDNNIDFLDIQEGSQATFANGRDIEITADAAGSEGLNVDGTIVLTSSSTIGDTDMLVTDTVGDMDLNGTVTINGSNGVDITAGSEVFIDGNFTVNLDSTENVTINTAANGIDIGATATTDTYSALLTLNNQLVLSDEAAVGNNGDTVRIVVGSSSGYTPTTTNAYALTGTEFDLANGAILEVTAGTITGLDLGDDIYVLDTTDFEINNTDADFTSDTTLCDTCSVRLIDTAVLNLERSSNATADDLIITATLNDLNSVFSSGTYVTAGNALFAAPSTTGGNLATIRNNFLVETNASNSENIAESIAPTVDGGTVAGAMSASGQTLSVNNARIASLRDGTAGQTGMVAGNLAEGLKAWGQVFGSTAEQDRRDNVDGFEADTFGFALGIDTETLADNWIWGLSFAYADTEVDSDNANSTNTEIDSYQIGVYANYDWDERTYVSGQLAYVFGDNDSRRSNVGNIAGLTASGDYDSDQVVARLEAGRNYSFNETTTVTPSVLLNYAYYDADSYSETGAGNAGLTVNSEAVSVLELGVGLDASWLYQQADGSYLKPEVRAGVRYDFLDDEVEATSSFVGVAGTSFKTQGFDPAQTTFNLGLGLTYFSTTNWELSADYDFEVKEDYDSHAGVLRAAYKF